MANLAADDPADLYDLLVSIDARLARLEQVLAVYEPLLAEVSRRVSGPLRWRKEQR
jgi:hypothetical protein